MIEPNDINLNYIRKARLNGSDQGMRYRLELDPSPDGEELLVTVWPEPCCFFKTPPDKKTASRFPFSPEGLQAATDWMNEQHRTNTVFTARPAG